MGASWVVQEFGGVELGDERRNERAVELVTALSETPGGALSRACPDEASLRAAVRFFDNEHFLDEDLLAEHIRQTALRISNFKLVYVPQDTTSANFQGLRSTKGLGPISKSEAARGLLLHSSLAITPNRVSLGILHQAIWARETGKHTASDRRRLPIEDKESFKWLKGLRALNHIAPMCPDTQLVSICDREGDIYNMLVEPREENVELLIRGAQNRSTRNGEQKDRIYNELSHQQVCAQVVVNVPKSGNLPARQAHLDVRFKRVFVLESKWMSETKAYSTGVPEKEVWVILAQEPHPPKNIKQSINWMLYSTRPIETTNQALEAIDAYSARWVIEVWHKTLKSGLNIEGRQSDTAARLSRNLTLLSVIAWRVHHVMMLSRAEPDLPCTVCFEDDEWRAAWCRHHRTSKPPMEPPKLRDFVRMMCNLSGFLGRKNEGEPGVKRIAMALDYLAPMTETYRALTRS